ncbi:MAG: hypothetical protein ACOCTT_02655 [archaeon]
MEGKLTQNPADIDTYNRLIRTELKKRGHDGIVYTDSELGEYQTIEDTQTETNDVISWEGVNDTIQKIYRGDKKVKLNDEDREDLNDSMGRAFVERMSSDQGEPLEDVAEQMDRDKFELMDELKRRRDRYYRDTGTTLADIEEVGMKEAEKNLKEYFPHVIHVREAGDGRWNWNDLTEQQKKAVMVNSKIYREDDEYTEKIPSAIQEELDEKFENGEFEDQERPGQERELEHENIVMEDVNVKTSKNRYQLNLNLTIEDTEYFMENLDEINEEMLDMGERLLFMVGQSDRGEQGYTATKKLEGDKFDTLISVESIDNLFTYGHETMHQFDMRVVYPTMSYYDERAYERGNREKPLPKSLSDRIGVSDKYEEELAIEMQRVHRLVNPFRTKPSQQYVNYLTEGGSEGFANWGSLYLNDEEMAKIVAPRFTAGMEAKFGDQLNKIKGIYEDLDGRARVPKDSTWKEVFDGMKLFGKFVGKYNGTLGEKIQNTFAYDALERGFRATLVTPFFIGFRDEEFNKVFRAVADNSSYFRHRRKNEIQEKLDFDLIKDMEDHRLERVAQLLKEGNSKSRQRYFEDEELDRMNVGKKEKALYKQMVEVIEEITDNTVEILKYRYGFYDLEPEDRVDVEKKIKKGVEKLGGYVPMNRLNAQYAVYAEYTGKVKDSKTSRDFFRTYSSKQRKEAEAHMERFRKSDMYKDPVLFEPGKEDRLPTRFKTNDLSMSELDSLITSAGIDKDSEVAKKLKEALQEKLAEKGAWEKNLLKRNYVPGKRWDWDSVFETIMNRVDESSEKLSRAKGFYEANKAIDEIDEKNNKENKAAAIKYVNDFYNSSRGQFRRLRQATYISHLAFKTSYLVQNLFQRYLITLPYTASDVGMKKALNISKEAQKIEAKLWKYNFRDEAPPEDVDDEIIEIFDRGLKEKMLAGVFEEEALGGEKKIKSMFMNALGMFGIVSDTSNRVNAAITGHLVRKELAKEDDKIDITNSEENYEYAKEYVETTQVPYGSHNIPSIISGSGDLRGVVKAMFTFKQFALHDLQLGIEMFRKSKTAGAWYSIVRILLAGLMGITPLLWANKGVKWLGSLFGKDIDPIQSVKSMFAGSDSEAVNTLGDIMMNGVPSQGGVDTSNMFSYGSLIHPDFNWKDQIIGPTWGMTEHGKNALEELRVGNMRGALTEFNLTSVKNALTAEEWADKDAIEIGNYVKIEPTNFEIGAKALSFQPQRITKAYDLEGMVMEYKENRGLIRDRIKNKGEEIREDGKLPENIEKQILEHNKNVQEDMALLDLANELNVSRDKQESMYKGMMVREDLLSNWIEESNE